MPQSKVRLKRPEIRHANLGPYAGLAYKEDFEIELDPALKSKEYLETLIHEQLHCYLPDLSEYMIDKMGKLLTNEIWKRRYRRIEKT